MSKPKFEKDAERAKTRSFAGYVKDRVMGKADFDSGKASKTEKKPARTEMTTPGAGMQRLIGNRKEMIDKASGYKAGGKVKRGYGMARCK